MKIIGLFLLTVQVWVSFAVFALDEQKTCNNKINWQAAQVNEEELLLVVLRVNNSPVAQSIDLYPHKDTHLLPISLLNDIFKVPWYHERAPLRFFSQFKENHKELCSFSIDFSASNEGELAYFYADDFDVYVDINVIASLINGDSSFNYQLMQLNFTSADKALGQQQKSAQPVFNTTRSNQQYPIFRSKYQWLSSPLVNYRLGMNYSADEKELSTRANVNANFDLAYLASNYRLGYNNGQAQQFLRFSRNILLGDTQQNEMGNVDTIDDRALKYEFGDIFLQSDELINSGQQALGINLFTESQNRRASFSSIRIEETVLPGWRGVLFRNGEFIEQNDADENNLVVFEDVATFYGANNFEIRLYGPQGQEEIRQQYITVGNDQQSVGQFDFRLQASDARRRLLDGEVNSGENSTKRLSASVHYGFNRHISLSAGFYRQENMFQSRSYLSATADVNVKNSVLRFKYANQLNGGYSSFIGINSRLSKHFRVNASHTSLDNFLSDRYAKTNRLASETRARLNARLPTSKPINMRLSYNERRFKDGSANKRYSAGVSHDFMGNTLSNDISLQENKNNRTFAHRAFWSHGIKDWRLQHSLSWMPFDGAKVQSYSTNLRWPQKLKTFNETRLQLKRRDKTIVELAHQFSWRTDYFNLQMGAQVDDTGDYSFNLGISGDIYLKQSQYKPTLTQPRGSQNAQILTLAFLDKNRNGVFDDNDEPLQDIGFSGSASWRGTTTNEHGYAQLFTSSRYQRIGLDWRTIGDPFIVPANNEIIVNTHAGAQAILTFPMLAVNDIEGQVYLNAKQSKRGMAGIQLNLVSKTDSSQTYSTKTDGDGFYYFTEIPPGEYSLSVEDEFLERRSIAKPQPLDVIAPEIGDIVSLANIDLWLNNSTSS